MAEECGRKETFRSAKIYSRRETSNSAKANSSIPK
jgi:hypothetical protein